MSNADRGGRGERARLCAELERMRGASAASVLQIAEGAGPEAARSAFLRLVKRYHPHRFARAGDEIEKLANELFLEIKAAYDQLRSAPPQPARPERRTRPPEPPGPPRRAVRFRKTPAAGTPISRSRTPPRGARVRRPRPAATPPRGAPVSGDVKDQSDLLAAIESEDEQRERTFREAVKLIKTGSPAEARAMFKELAVGRPDERRFRVYMHYAWGREHQGAGRLEKAAAEFRRALKLDPSLDEAAEALEQVSAHIEKESAGVFSRLFRRGR